MQTPSDLLIYPIYPDSVFGLRNLSFMI
uniref:Uncharacterized protein n=1 Tax=Rhizophora mucronata TaxID=61149 RepID=A0A2P2QE84_RHIMU